jgi:hypothetical protein
MRGSFPANLIMLDLTTLTVLTENTNNKASRCEIFFSFLLLILSEMLIVQ